MDPLLDDLSQFVHEGVRKHRVKRARKHVAPERRVSVVLFILFMLDILAGFLGVFIWAVVTNTPGLLLLWLPVLAVAVFLGKFGNWYDRKYSL